MKPIPARLAVLFVPLLACAGGDGTTDQTASDNEALAETTSIDIGGNTGTNGSGGLAYQTAFRAQNPDLQTGPSTCHTYTAWDVVYRRDAAEGTPSENGSPAALKKWLAEAQAAKCDEVLISFQGSAFTGVAPGHIRGRFNGRHHVEQEHYVTNPSTDGSGDVKRAFRAFRQTDWKTLTGYTGKFAFTAWNEPNGGGDGTHFGNAGNGLPFILAAETAARYYLAMASVCWEETHGGNGPGCTVAAGDFASNGVGVRDFLQECGSDVDASLCRGASYLDKYKHTIARHAHQFGLPGGYRPEVFSFHGWADVNGYLRHANSWQCDTDKNCVIRALSAALQGSWAHVKLWDTEIGSGQDGDNFPHPLDQSNGEHLQACGVAFILHLHHLYRGRLERIYYTRFHGGPGALFPGAPDGPTSEGERILARHQTAMPPGCEVPHNRW